MKTGTDDIKKRLKHREDMFLRRLMWMLANMARINDACCDGVSRRSRCYQCQPSRTVAAFRLGRGVGE